MDQDVDVREIYGNENNVYFVGVVCVIERGGDEIVSSSGLLNEGYD